MNWVIEALGLDFGLVKGKHTPSESKPLVKNLNVEAESGAFSYISVVGMLLYLSGHIHPDITFAAFLLCSISIHLCPKHLHELALKRTGRYLKQTSDHGMVTNSSSNVCKIDAYPYDVVMSRTTLIPHVLRVAWDSSSLCWVSCILAIKLSDRDSSIHDGSRNHSSSCLLQRAVSYHWYG